MRALPQAIQRVDEEVGFQRRFGSGSEAFLWDPGSYSFVRPNPPQHVTIVWIALLNVPCVVDLEGPHGQGFFVVCLFQPIICT